MPRVLMNFQKYRDYTCHFIKEDRRSPIGPHTRFYDFATLEELDAFFQRCHPDDHGDLLYDLASQTVKHLQTYLSDVDTSKVLRCYQREIARFIHSQMQEHFWEEASGYETKITKGFTELQPSAYTVGANDSVLDYRIPPQDKSNMSRYLFGGFEHCLYSVEKFQSDPERRLAVILARTGEVVQAAQGSVPALLQVGSGPSGVPARLRSRG